MVRKESSRKGDAVEVSNLKEILKRKRSTASFHKLKPVNTAKDLPLLLSTAAWVAKAVSQITTDIAETKVLFSWFCSKTVTQTLAQRRNGSMQAETTAAGLLSSVPSLSS